MNVINLIVEIITVATFILITLLWWTGPWWGH